MQSLSPLQLFRLTYQPKLPFLLNSLHSLAPIEIGHKREIEDLTLKNLFPETFEQPFLSFKKGEESDSFPALKIGVVLSGGQAPGGHNVISGLFDALKKLNPNSQLIGFCNGPNGILKNQIMEITSSLLAHYRNQGGFDLIGSGRTKIETLDQFQTASKTIKDLDLDGLVIIGGDDSNTNAAFLAEYFKQNNIKTTVVGVPKTIDGDLKNEWIETSFGFDTASKIYSEIIGNILKDSLSAKKYYYFIKLMGRSASHLTLECALQTHVNLALISEEVEEKKQSLSNLISQIVEMIVQRAMQGKQYGAILIPEGIIEFIPEFKEMIQELNALLAPHHPYFQQFNRLKDKVSKVKDVSQQLSLDASQCFNSLPLDIQMQLLLDRDPHGNVQVSKIEIERLFIHLVEQELNIRKEKGQYDGKFAAQSLFCGYEGRSGLPTNFDCQYCYSLGHVAALLLSAKASGYMSCVNHLTQPVEEWSLSGIPIFSLLHLEVREGKQKAVIRKALVDLKGKPFAVFASQRENWKMADDYCCPGPIQFMGPSEIADTPPLTLIYETWKT